MKARILIALLVAVVAVGCGGIKEEDHLAAVAACEEETARWESMYQESVTERQQALDQALTMLPTAHEDLRSQIDLRLGQVTADLDEAIKAEVQESFYELAEAIADGYNNLQEENQMLQVQLGETRRVIDQVLTKTGAIEEKAGSIQTSVTADQQAIVANRQAALIKVGEVETFMRDWQYMYVDCKGCDERLRINKKERDALAKMHDSLMGQLAEVREQLTAPGEG
jgi:hypothetical protein